MKTDPYSGNVSFMPAPTLGEPQQAVADQQAQQAQNLPQLQGFLGQQQQQVQLLADLYRSAGMANAADAFQSRQRATILEAARRGQRGSSIEMERRNEGEQQLRQDVAGVEQQAAQQESQGLLGVVGQQRQLGSLFLGNNPYTLLGRQQETNSLQQQIQGLQGLGSAQQDQYAAREGNDSLQGQILGNALSALGTAGRGAILGYYNRPGG